MFAAGILILRLVVGLTLAAHGAQKLFGWWGGPGMKGWIGAMNRMRIRPATPFSSFRPQGQPDPGRRRPQRRQMGPHQPIRITTLGIVRENQTRRCLYSMYSRRAFRIEMQDRAKMPAATTNRTAALMTNPVRSEEMATTVKRIVRMSPHPADRLI